MEQNLYFPVCVLAAVMSVILAGGPSSTIDYTCNPDDTIDISGLPANYSYYAMQDANPDVQCVVSSTGETSVRISGCSKDLDILLTYSTYDNMDTNSLHGGKNVSAVKIKCNELPSSGSVHTINNTFAANLTVEEEADVSPTYNVSSSLSTYYTTVGSEVTWTISFPAEYILQVTDCTAYAGMDDSSADSVTLISSGGCTITDELVSQFTDNMDGTATATILAFKFYNEDNIFLTCDLLICPSNSTTCDTSCSRSKRDIHSRTARDAARGGYPSGTDDSYTKAVHNVLHVIDPKAMSGSMRCKLCFDISSNRRTTSPVSPFNMSMTFTFLLIFLVTRH